MKIFYRFGVIGGCSPLIGGISSRVHFHFYDVKLLCKSYSGKLNLFGVRTVCWIWLNVINLQMVFPS